MKKINENKHYVVFFLIFFAIMFVQNTTTVEAETDMANVAYLLSSPYKQIEYGILPENIECNIGLELILKSNNNSPVCVTPETKIKLIEREWAKLSEHNQDIVKVDYPETQIIIAIEDAIDSRGLVPIMITQVTNVTMSDNNVQLLDFKPENFGEVGSQDIRIGWDLLPPNHRISHKIFDENDDDPINRNIMSEGFTYPTIGYTYLAICGENAESKRITHSWPITIPIKSNESTIFSMSDGGGLLPNDKNEYVLSFTSFFEQNVKLPEDAIILSDKSRLCSVVQHDNFERAYNNDIVFKLVN